MKILEKVKNSRYSFVKLQKKNLLGKHLNHFKNIKTSLKNDPFDRASMNIVLYFGPEYFKLTSKEIQVK